MLEMLGQKDSFAPFGWFDIQHYNGDGELLWEETKPNLVLTVGRNHILDVVFASGTQVTTWHIGLSNDNTSITATYSLTGEVGTRQATSFTRTNQTVASDQESFTTITDTVRKAFVVTASSMGTVIAVSDLSTPRVLTSSDTLKVTYSISATAS